MEIVFGWIVLSLLAGYVASTKNRSAFGYFLLSLILSPIIAFIALIAVPAIPDGANRIDSNGFKVKVNRTCPFCAEAIQPAAIVCKHCGRDLPVEQESKTDQELMDKYGISQEGDQYIYKTHRYADLHDAVNYAKKESEKQDVYVC